MFKYNVINNKIYMFKKKFFHTESFLQVTVKFSNRIEKNNGTLMLAGY